MKRRQLLFGVILGLLGAVHCTPLGTVSDIPAQPEEDVFDEVMTEGFLINEPTNPLPSGESFTTNTTSQAPQLSHFMTEGSGEIPSFEWLEGSGQNPIGNSTVLTEDLPLTAKLDETPEYPHATLWPHLEFTTEGSGVAPHSERIDVSGENPFGASTVHTQESPPAESKETTKSIIIVFEENSTSDSSTIKTTRSNVRSVQVATRRPVGSRRFETNLANPYPGTDAIHSPTPDDQPILNAQSRPDWLIIFGFAVGIAVLIGFFVAVATRDKWIKKLSSLDKESNLLTQTFLHKNEPKENRQNGEYTFVPLSEISGNGLSN